MLAGPLWGRMRHGRGAGCFALPSVRWSPQLVTIHSLKLTPTKPTLPKSTDAFSESVIAFGCDPCLVSCQISPINQFLHVNQLVSEWVSPWVLKLMLSLHIPLMLPLLVGVLDETDSCEVLSGLQTGLASPAETLHVQHCWQVTFPWKKFWFLKPFIVRWALNWTCGYTVIVPSSSFYHARDQRPLSGWHSE